MNQFDADSCDGVYRQAAESIQKNGYEQASRTQPTRELRHVNFSIRNPRDRIVFSRPINPAFALVEFLWIMAGRRDESYLHFWNPRMSRWANEEGNLCGYGHRLRHHFGVDQLKQAAETLQKYGNSRQVVLQIWDPEMDLPDPEPQAKDVPCNLTSHLMLRDDRLHWLQMMRSNDLIWGTPYNFIQFTLLQEVIAGWVGADLGNYEHISSSLHVYRRHWNHYKSIPDAPDKPSGSLSDLRLSMTEWEEIEGDLFELPDKFAEVEDTTNIHKLIDEYAHLPKPYRQWVALLAAEALRRHGANEEAKKVILRAGNYWSESWRRWLRRKEDDP